MPIKVAFAFFIIAALVAVLLYYAPISVILLVFAFSVAWSIHTILYYFAEKENRP
jgi:hypothetical protein